MTQKIKNRRFRLVASWMMRLCFVISVGRLLAGFAPAIEPALTTGEINCASLSCVIDYDPRRLLARAGGPAFNADPHRIEQVVSTPQARSLIAGAGVIVAIPSALMFLALGFAFRNMRAGSGFVLAARWLRRAALFALLAVLLGPVASTMIATALSPLSAGSQQLIIFFDFPQFLWGLMVAGSAWVAVWILEQALAARRRLEEIV
ncbi:MAG TPA: hypothetical protein VEC11_11755 [Allosphingosinicella sp.]|nr:hypothetical protein [Allosphingosinicella sp.]